MAVQSGNPLSLAIKKLAAMGLLVIGLILTAAGSYYASAPMILSGAIALGAAVVLLIWKIRKRNERL